MNAVSRLLRAVAIGGLALGLAACPAARKPEPAPEVPAPPAPETVPTYPGAEAFAVVADQSLVRILVHRGGKLASAGHNHVIVSRNLNGTFWVHPELSRSGFQIVMPVNLLEVDDPQIRAQEGPDFPREVPESARTGTRRNLLSAELLDGERYPGVTVTSVGLSGTRESAIAKTRIQIKDQSREVEIPVTITSEGDAVVATGEFTLLQSDFGITPFSILMGAVTVQDELKIKFRLTSRRSSP